MLTAIMLCTGRLHQITESLASFAGQEYPDKELIVVNLCQRQTLVLNMGNTSVFNVKEMCLPMKAKTWAVTQARGDVIVMWGEQNVALPNFLSQIADAIKGKEWLLFEHELCFQANQRMVKQAGSEFSFAFTKTAFAKCGPYPPGIQGASDRQLLGKITTTCPGERVNNEQINLIRMGTAEERERVGPAIDSGIIKLQPKLNRDYGALVEMAKTGKRANRLCVVQLGRYGDIISILPLVKWIADHYEKPHFMVSQKFANILDGVSYCKPFVTQLSNEKLGDALDIAKDSFAISINFAVWGEKFQQKKRTQSYCQDAWANGGFLHRWDDPTLYPVFDQRDPAREALVIDRFISTRDKPIICVNVKDAISSPCNKCLTVLEEIRKIWSDQCTIVDLSGFKAERIYDMLGLFEISKCLVSLDSAFLHLAQATEIGIVAIINPKPWAGTVVRRNLVAQTDYATLDMAIIHEGIAASLERPVENFGGYSAI